MNLFQSYTQKQKADDQTKQAEAAMRALGNLLRDAVATDHRLDWSGLKDRKGYPVPRPEHPKVVAPPSEPQRLAFQPKRTWFTRLIKPLRERVLAEREQRYRAAYSAWQATRAEIAKRNRKQLDQYDQEVSVWETKRAAWLEEQQGRNAGIDNWRTAYLRREAPAIVNYCIAVLTISDYPETFPREFELDYLPETRLLVVDFALPSVEALPNAKAYKYVATRDEIQPVAVADSWLNKTYDSVLYQIALRTLYELFRSDEANALKGIVFNGWVNSVDAATGKEVNPCVLTIEASKAEFLEINLARVDPRACFKKLKGISAASLRTLSPIRPILQLNKEDKRFVQAYSVVGALDESANLAAMDWEDFEHLIRELFEEEFSREGAEVKITQSSRDRGVDAVVFDPDPIKGGKIIIQAKRYTNTVGVSAVRDLFGTIHNEGANKGILVTTADYGHDAYEFAKEKPITLLSGSELLYLLRKHGHKARIDLAEARLLAAERDKAEGTTSEG